MFQSLFSDLFRHLWHPKGVGICMDNAVLLVEVSWSKATLQSQQMSRPLIYSLVHTGVKLVSFFNCLSTLLISGQWVSEDLSTYCDDRGPNNNCEFKYTGFNQMCCLNNMTPLRSDVHDLFDAYEIVVDIFVSLPPHHLECIPPKFTGWLSRDLFFCGP
jgi:hypothetical protein